MEINSESWIERKKSNQQINPVLAHDYLVKKLKQKEISNKYNVNVKSVSKASAIYGEKKIKNLYGETNKTILLIDNNYLKEVRIFLENAKINHRFAIENATLTERYTSKIGS